MVPKALTRKGLPLLAAVALLTGPLVASARALPAAPPLAGQASRTQPTVGQPAVSQPAVNPAHVKVLAAALKKMHDHYASFANFTPGPQDIFDYNIGNLWLKGIDGSGTTVAVIEGWDDPNVAAFIHVRDVRYGLPDPVIQTIYPSGPLPAQCPPGMVALGSYGSCDAWQGELELDVLTVHLIAPYAKIVISATPADSEITDDAASNVAPPEMMHALEYISAHHIANAISISDGTGEGTYSFGTAQIHANDPGPLAAAAAGIPVLNATGDCGVVQNLAVANAQCGNTSAGPQTATWDDNPWVTAVGGTVPNVSKTDGSKLGPDPIWHQGGIFAEGAGFSAVYPRPSYQDRVNRSRWRSVPDITMDSQSGTSESAPMVAGVTGAGDPAQPRAEPRPGQPGALRHPRPARHARRPLRRGEREQLGDRPEDRQGPGAGLHRGPRIRRRERLGHRGREYVRARAGGRDEGDGLARSARNEAGRELSRLEHAPSGSRPARAGPPR